MKRRIKTEIVDPRTPVKVKKPFYKRWWFGAIVGFMLVGAIGSAMAEPDQVTTDNTPSEAVETEAPKPEVELEIGESKEPEETPDVPQEFKSALNKAEAYGTKMYMSKQAIYDQLTSEYGEKFSPEAAQYAVDNLDIDYKQNALEKAKRYQSKMDMSPERIRDQLTSEYGEQFTAEEADYAIANLPK